MSLELQPDIHHCVAGGYYINVVTMAINQLLSMAYVLCDSTHSNVPVKSQPGSFDEHGLYTNVPANWILLSTDQAHDEMKYAYSSGHFSMNRNGPF